ncbi:MAG: hypothetical protein R2861_03655 [Desulfobacterales bacterium]
MQWKEGMTWAMAMASAYGELAERLKISSFVVGHGILLEPEIIGNDEFCVCGIQYA